MGRGLRVVLVLAVGLCAAGAAVFILKEQTRTPPLDGDARALCGLAADKLIDDEVNLAPPTGTEIEEGLRDPPARVRRVDLGARWTMRSIPDLAERDVGSRERALLRRYADDLSLPDSAAWRLERAGRRTLVVYPRERLGVQDDRYYAPPDVVGDLDGDGSDELAFTAADGAPSPTLIAFGRPPKGRVTELVRDWPATRIEAEEETLRVAVPAQDCTGDGRRDALMLYRYEHCKDALSVDTCEFDRQWRVYAFGAKRAPAAGRLERTKLRDDTRMHLVAVRDAGLEDGR